MTPRLSHALGVTRQHRGDELFTGSTEEVARRLLGQTLVRRIPYGRPDGGARVAGRIVETEAYLPLVDPSCHAYRGPTKRNATMYGRPGTAYVYFIYGNHYCLNVVTEPPGIGGAVLIRAAEPIAGIDAMRRRRGERPPTDALASGPGNICRAFEIDLECDGRDLRAGDLAIEEGAAPSDTDIGVGPRIGLSAAAAWPLRFVDLRSKSISPFRRRVR